MPKRDYFIGKKPVAYYSGGNGIEIYAIDHDRDCVYYTAGAWNGKTTYHRAKIYYGKNDNPYFCYHGYRIPFNDCIRM